MQKYLDKMKSSSTYIWNMIGSVIYSGSSFVLLLAVTRSVDEKQAGIYSIVFSISQLLLSVGRYGMRPFQATDIQKKYTFGEYLASRVITCVLMLLGGLGYGLVFRFESYKLQVLLWICVLKMTDAVEDVFHGCMQRQERLDVAGKLLAARNVFSVVLFAIVISVSKDVLVASAVTAIGSMVFAILINLCGFKWNKKESTLIKGKNVTGLLKECASLFVAMFLIQYIYNAPKMAIDRYLPIEVQTYYGILFMISFVISICSEMIFRPLLTKVARDWNEQKPKEVFNTLLRMLVAIGIGGLLLEVLGAKLVLDILSYIYHIKLGSYLLEFRILLFGGVVSAAVYFLYNVLTAIRSRKVILFSYVVSAIGSMMLPFVLTRNLGLIGACISYAISMMIVFVGLMGGYTINYYAVQRKCKSTVEN